MKAQLHALGFNEGEVTKLMANQALAQVVIESEISREAFVRIFNDASLTQAEKLEQFTVLVNGGEQALEASDDIEEQNDDVPLTQLELKEKLLEIGLSEDDIEKISSFPVKRALVQHYEALAQLNLGNREDLMKISCREGAFAKIVSLAKHGKTLKDKFHFTKEDFIKMATPHRGASFTIDLFSKHAETLLANGATRDNLISLYNFNGGKGRSHIGRMELLNEQGLLANNTTSKTSQLVKRSSPNGDDQKTPDKRARQEVATVVDLSLQSSEEESDHDEELSLQEAKRKLSAFGFSKENIEEISSFPIMLQLVRYHGALTKLGLGHAELLNISCRRGAFSTLEALAVHGQMLKDKFHFRASDLFKMGKIGSGAAPTINFFAEHADTLLANGATSETLVSVYSHSAANDGRTHAARIEGLTKQGFLNQAKTSKKAPTINDSSLPGLELQPVPANGHCLYHAVAVHCGLTHLELRERVADHIEANLEDFGDIIGLLLEPHQTLEQYLRDVRSGNEWADNVEIAALKFVLNRPIMILDREHRIRSTHDDDGDYAGDPIFVSYNGRDHYDALVLTGQMDARSIQTHLLELQRQSEEQRKAERDQRLTGTSQVATSSNLFQPVRPTALRQDPTPTIRWEFND